MSSHPVPADGFAKPTTQSTRSLREHEARRVNHVDAVSAQAIVHDLYAEGDMPSAEGTATDGWGEAINVQGWDALSLLVDHIAGTSTNGVMILAQCAFGSGKDPARWWDLHEVGPGGVTQRWERTVPTGVDLRANVPVYDTWGVWMRFKVWADGADPADSRATVYAVRRMRAS